MSKSMNKAALATGAALSLVVAGFGALPSSANDTVAIAVGSGSSQIGVMSDDGLGNIFELKTTMSPGLSSNDGTLSYRIANPSAAELHLYATTGTLDRDDTPTEHKLQDGTIFEYSKTTADTDNVTNIGDIIVRPSLGDLATGDVTRNNTLGIAVDNGSTSFSDPITVTVTPFLNTVAASDNESDSVELSGTPIEITFYPLDEIAWSTTFNPVAGDASLTAAVVPDVAINGNYFDEDFVWVDFGRPGASTTVSDRATFNAVRGTWDNVSNPVDLDGSVSHWIGMPNVVGLDESSNDSVRVSYRTDRDSAVGEGDIVTVVSSGTNDVTRYAVSSATTREFSVNGLADSLDEDPDTGHVVVEDRAINTIAVASDLRTVTVTTSVAHGLTAGDVVSIDSARSSLDSGRNGSTVTSVPSSTSFKVSLSADGTELAAESDAGTFNYKSFLEVAAGDYTATAYVGGTSFSATAAEKQGDAESGTLAPVSSSVLISTTPSSSVGTALDPNGDGTYDTIDVKRGTTSVTVTATVLDSDGDAVGAGRGVTVDTLSINGTVAVNGRTAAGQSLSTDANGQVTFSVTSTSGAITDDVTVTITPEGVASATTTFSLEWFKQSFGLYDLSTTSADPLATSGSTDVTITGVEDGSYTMRLAVLDQWYQSPADGVYRLKVLGQGVTDGFIALTNGEATVTVTDDDTYSSYSFDVDLQKNGVDVGNPVDVTFRTKSASILTGADGSDLYASTSADLSNIVSLKALVEKDDRLAAVATPAYGNDVVVTGKIIDASTRVGLEGAPVTITGPSNMLFTNGAVASRGSITFMSDSNGEFAVTLNSTTAQSATELTISSLGATNTVKVTFTGQTAGEGSVLTIDAPSFVSSASSFQATVNLSDELGNGVSTATDNTIKITRTGPGIAFGTLPTNTDANGNASFSVLLGANDSGTITVTASYDQNDDGDYTDTKDLTVTKTITIGEAPAAQKVNAGSFKGYVAVYARGYEGQRLSAKVGNDWVIVDPIVNNESDDLHRTTDFTGAGVDIAVRIYIDRVLIDTINLTTK